MTNGTEITRSAIGDVCRRTGLKPDRLRVWERRHGAVAPRRSASGQRLYTESDIGRLCLLRRATGLGWSIGQIVHLTDDQLVELTAWESREATAPPAQAVPPSLSVDGWLPASLAAVQALDGGRLVGELMQAAATLDRQALLEELLLVPLMQRIGALWQDGVLRPAHEHLATAVVKTFLCGLQGSLRRAPQAPTLAVATPLGQHHELGALLVAATAAAEGWHVLYLGPNLPAAEIAEIAREIGARAVALSLTYPADDPHLGAELTSLRHQLDPAVTLLAGGQAAPAYGPTLQQIGAHHPTDLAALRTLLAGLGSTG